MVLHYKRKSHDPDALKKEGNSYVSGEPTKSGIYSSAESEIPVSSSSHSQSATFIQQPGKSTWAEIQHQMSILKRGTNTITSKKQSSGDDDEDEFLVYLRDEILPMQKAMKNQFFSQASRAESFQVRIAQYLESAKHESIVQMEKAKDLQAKQMKQAEERAKLWQELRAIGSTVATAQDMIAHHQGEASLHLQACEDVGEERRSKEVKLRQKLSLYMACTGVKWNYNPEPSHLLEAHVTGPPHQALSRFIVDPSRTSSTDITRSLWDAMGGVSHHI